MNKEHNFISAVVYISKDEQQNVDFFKALDSVLDEHFLHYELIVVNGNSAVNSIKELSKWAKSIDRPLTVVNMSLHQPHEQCMNAGIDISIGDYVYEFDSTEVPYPPEMIWEAYLTAMKGNDIVNVCPNKERRLSSIFYSIFNRYSHSSVKLRTDVFRLVSRRAINRVHSISENLPYRKAAYAASGLKMDNLEFEGCLKGRRSQRSELAINSLVLYTDFGFRFSMKVTLAMGLITAALFVYAILQKIGGQPIDGWTSLACITSFGLSGLFFILAMVIKYLALQLQLTFRKQSYLIESTEKM
jgi:dolichol-phosphate mannosyltransferase